MSSDGMWHIRDKRLKCTFKSRAFCTAESETGKRGKLETSWPIMNEVTHNGFRELLAITQKRQSVFTPADSFLSEMQHNTL